jgi:hypothetical protein
MRFSKTTPRLMAALAAAYLVGCMGVSPADDSAVGRLDLPLVSTGSNGSQFALAGTFDLIGVETLSQTVNPADGNFLSSDVLTMNPRVGSYTLTLSGFQLYRVDTAMTPPSLVPATGATLTSPATVALDILNNQTTQVVYQFSVPGSGTIVFARGTLDIDFEVGEGLPVGAPCTDNTQCASLVCNAALGCAVPTCTDGVQNGDETSPDCGPSCSCAGPSSTCTSAQWTQCNADQMCVVDAAGTVSCLGGNPPGGTDGTCTSAQWVACRADQMCVVDAAGMVSCL